jgi:hypothetical protein
MMCYLLGNFPSMQWSGKKQSKKKPEPDVEFVAQFSLSACVDRLETLHGSESESGNRLHIQVDPIDSTRWKFKATRRSLHRIKIEVRGSLLKRDELSTIVLIRGYTSQETAQWINAIFVVLLLIILGIMSFFLAAKALVLVILIALVTLFPLFSWRFVDFDGQSTTDRQQLEQLIKRSLEF